MAALALAAAAGGCADVVASENLVEVRFVVVDDRAYTAGESLAGAGAVGEKYAEVLRFVDCSGGLWLGDTTGPDDWCPLEDGDSNFLPEGTAIHRVESRSPAEALTAHHDGAWVELRPVPQEGS